MAYAFIKNSYTNYNKCRSPADNIKIQTSHKLENVPTHDTEYNKKGFAHQNINTNNTSVIEKIVKIVYERVALIAW